MTQTMTDIQKALLMPFDPGQVHWRIGSTNARYRKEGQPFKGVVLAYLDARDVMERLDEVVGIWNWQARYPFAGCCEVGLNLIAEGGGEENNEWVWKANAAGETQVEAEKGQASDAFKRAAVLWGIGRCYYDLPNTKHELAEFNGKPFLSKELKATLTGKLDAWQKKWVEANIK